MESGVEFIAVDNPHANKLTLHILAAVAEHEREMISERTKGALQAARTRGVKLGRNGSERLATALPHYCNSIRKDPSDDLGGIERDWAIRSSDRS
jgi:DNA invertase Pin-like site-specific DNA recombinase